jgi:lipopolysaccharide assembly outer membrane protein LptD (OstA)
MKVLGTIVVFACSILIQMPLLAPRDRNPSIVADTQTVQGNSIFFRGHVRLFSDTMELTADELDFDRLSRTFDVRGNVRVRLLPLTVRMVPLSGDR